MKKLFCILLCFCLLTACGAQKMMVFEKENPSVTEVYEFVRGSEKLMGVAYLGCAEGDFSAVSDYLAEQSFLGRYAFVTAIEETHFVQMEGTELYCVLPADESVSLKIHQAVLDETNHQLTAGQELLSVSDGIPVLLQGNISDIMPNLMIVATKGDVAVQYVPCLSLENGALSNPEQLVYDFTPYSFMSQYVGDGTEAQWDFYGDWSCIVEETDGTTFQLNLSISADGVKYTYASDKVTGDFHGEWFIISDGKLRLSTDGNADFADMDGVAAQYLEMDALFFWEVNDAGLKLKHFNGDRFYPGALQTEFQFTPIR